jgi:ankyrin repeat protein
MEKGLVNYTSEYITEEPDAVVPHVRICVGAVQVTGRSTMTINRLHITTSLTMMEKFTKKNINIPDDEGVYPIHKICSNCYNDTRKVADLDEVLDLGADVEVKAESGMTPLLVACGNGKQLFVKRLLQKGVFVDAVDNHGRTALHWAVEGSNGSIQLLIEAGAQLDCKDDDGLTPLHMACKIGKVGAVKRLCELGANTEIIDKSGLGLVGVCLRKTMVTISYSNSLEMVRALLRYGAPLGCTEDKTCNTETHMVSKLFEYKRANIQILDVMKALIGKGANPWKKNNEGFSAIDLLDIKHVHYIRSSLAKSLRGNEAKVVLGIETVSALTAFFFNQQVYSKSEVYELLKEGTPAKKHFEETLRLPSIVIER